MSEGIFKRVRCSNCLSFIFADERLSKATSYCGRNCKDIYELKEQVKILTERINKIDGMKKG